MPLARSHEKPTSRVLVLAAITVSIHKCRRSTLRSILQERIYPLYIYLVVACNYLNIYVNTMLPVVSSLSYLFSRV